MPNWVSNILIIDAQEDKLREVLEAIKSETGELGSFDFNKVIPMPESLNVECGTITDLAISAYLYQLRTSSPKTEEYEQAHRAALTIKNKKLFCDINFTMTQGDVKTAAERMRKSEAELFDLGKQYIENQQQYGATTWYEFCNSNWGTKWNAPDGVLIDEEDPRIMNFDTAWSTPLPIIQTLSARFPDIDFTIKWTDEDIGHNVGRLTYRGGETIDGFVPEGGSKEAYELYFEIQSCEARDLFLKYDPDNNTYVYDEDLEQQMQAQIEALHAKPPLEDQVKDATTRSTEHSADITPTTKEPSR